LLHRRFSEIIASRGDVERGRQLLLQRIFQKICESIEKRLVKLVREEQKRAGDLPLVEIERNTPLPGGPYDLFLT
jgi:hypothetical protein